jgi:Flp pilus assembly protein CpaB
LSSTLFLLLAVASGLAAFALVRGYEARLDALHPAAGPPIPVVVAAQTLSRGQPVPAGAVELRRMPAAFAPPGSMRTVESVVGRIAVADVVAGEAVSRARLAPATAGPIAALVPPGLRAAFVPTELPEGAVRSGDRVDVFATYGGRAHTELAADGVEVLGTAGSSAAGAEQPLSPAAGTPPGGGIVLVVLVDQGTAERLAFARAFATLTVTVDGPAERGTSPSPPPAAPPA